MAIDLDPRDDGIRNWREITQGLMTTRVITGGGGIHYYLRDPGVKWPRKLAPGIDVQYGNKYVVAPPSIHPSGEEYRYDPQFRLGDVNPCECPDWLLAFQEIPKPFVPSQGVGEREDYLIEHLKLTQKKNRYWGVCPFHQEREEGLGTRFSVDMDIGYHCFSCGASGSVIDLLRRTTQGDF
jgi:hypothetical protein